MERLTDWQVEGLRDEKTYRQKKELARGQAQREREIDRQIKEEIQKEWKNEMCSWNWQHVFFSFGSAKLKVGLLFLLFVILIEL